MPTYEYRCPRGHAFEKFYRRITGHGTVKCPTCGTRARRLISGGAGLVFKGSGFYITDYKRSGEPKAGESKGGERPDAKAGDKPGVTSRDTTPAGPKPDAKAKKDRSDR